MEVDSKADIETEIKTTNNNDNNMDINVDGNDSYEFDEDLDDLMPEDIIDDVSNHLFKQDKTELDIEMEKDIARIMYSCGDNKKPFNESIELITTIINNFVKEFCLNANNIAIQNNRSIKYNDMLFLIRKDLKKFNKATNLLNFNNELKQLRKNDFKTIESQQNTL